MRLAFTTALALVALMVTASPLVAEDKPQDLIIGKWKSTDADHDAVIDFAKDGKLKIVGKDVSIDGSYKFLDDKTIEVKFQLGAEDKATKLSVTVTKEELVTVEDGKDKKITFKRVK